jgi:thiol-disulfide isomerase/thioredoxin
MRNIWIVVPAVAAAAVLGFFAHRWLGGPQAPEEAPAATASAVAGTGDEGAPADSPPALVIPETLPQFSLADRDGKLRTLGEWTGQPLMVNYWATWCLPCRREIPLLNELRAPGRGPKVEVIGIAVDFRDDVLKYASETPIDYPLLIGEEDGLKAVEAMGMQPAFPFTVFADSRQRILTVKVGELHRDDAELILARLWAVDAGTLPLEQAKMEIDAGLKDLATRRAAKGEATTEAAAPPGA